MGQNSKIEWTHHTFNPWIGCLKVHEGCAHCYAEADMDKRRKRVKWGSENSGGTRSKTSEANWREPLKWNQEAQQAGVRARVFCASLADVFEQWDGPIVDHRGNGLYRCSLGCGELLDGAKPSVQGAVGPYCTRCEKHTFPLSLDDLRRELFQLIDATPWLDWLLVTKRPENIRSMWPLDQCGDCDGAEQRGIACGVCGGVGGVHNRRENVWLLTSVSNQATADKQVPELLACRDLVPVLGLSCEPLLGPLSLAIPWDGERTLPTVQVDWVIVGGESGRQARPMHPQWARILRDQCQAAGVAFFFKQWGEFAPVPQNGEVPGPEAVPVKNVMRSVVLRADGDSSKYMPHSSRPDAQWMIPCGKHEAGRLLDGREWNEFPQVSVTVGRFLDPENGRHAVDHLVALAIVAAAKPAGV